MTVALITGATDGLGLETARRLGAGGASVLVHGRNQSRCAEAIEQLEPDIPRARLTAYWADLARLDEVRGLASRMREREERLDVLINNAGIADIDGPRRESPDGIELTFAVNYLAHFVLTLELLDILARSDPARIVNVTSVGQSPIDFSDPMLERAYDGFTAYARSKLAQISFTLELAHRLAAAGEDRVTVNAVHPATLMDTRMVRRTFGRARSSVQEGVEAVTRVATSPELDGATGRYFEGTGEAAPHRQALDPAARRRLWELSEQLAGVSSPV
ncbi:MAG: SDR family NAD(P)-dependent oxidoreductase [Solirubrobacteraceae bacterium]